MFPKKVLMKIIAISSGEGYKGEIPIVVELFKAGLDVLHLRKPNFSEQLMEEYLNAIPDVYHDRIVLHSFHDLALRYNVKGIHVTKRHKKKRIKTFFKTLYLKIRKPELSTSTSCHSLSNLNRYSRNYDYVFLSPVFNSISKSKRYAGFSFSKIKDKLQKNKRQNVYALGGVGVSKIDKCFELGFSGVVLLGALWKNDADPIKIYSEIKEKIQFHQGLNAKMKITPVQLDVS